MSSSKLTLVICALVNYTVLVSLRARRQKRNKNSSIHRNRRRMP